MLSNAISIKRINWKFSQPTIPIEENVGTFARAHNPLPMQSNIIENEECLVHIPYISYVSFDWIDLDLPESANNKKRKKAICFHTH